MNWFSNFGMSEWLIACAAILFVVVLIDGFRRMRAERQQDLKWDLQLARDFPETEDPLSDEMIESDYRVVNRGAAPDNFSSDISTAKGAHSSRELDEQPDLGGFNAIDEPVASPANKNNDGQSSQIRETTQAVASDSVNRTGVNRSGVNESAVAANGDDAGDSNSSEQKQFAPQELKIISLHVKGAKQEGFLGSDLVQVLLACNMRYGETNILHRFSDTSKNSGAIDFSVANMLEPGTFDLENLSGFRTPGITFFMALPGPADPLAVFNMMLETASFVAETLGGFLLDDEHSTATPQVINHYRDRIRQIVVQSQHKGRQSERSFAVSAE